MWDSHTEFIELTPVSNYKEEGQSSALNFMYKYIHKFSHNYNNHLIPPDKVSVCCHQKL